ncbi:MAG: hypothetical protein CSA66_00180 [Proteobacteria bacterium]|nr:MAG: hypothetical protein CSA66_00180 [Pseudomonadota bacterium]
MVSVHDPEAIEALKHANRQLVEFKYALDQAAIVAITDVTGTITYVNDKFCEISGYRREELVGNDHRMVNSGYHPKSFIRSLWRTIATGKVWRGELRNRSKRGDLYWVDTTIVPLFDDDDKPRRYLAIRTDITERKRVEALLRQKETMAQLGQMAAVIAHEVKNPLAGISGAIQVIARRMPQDSPDIRVLEEIRARVGALNESLTALLSFARPPVPKPRPVNTHEVVLKSAMVIANEPRYEAVELELTGRDRTIVADPDLLGQAVLNLVINAAQAIDCHGRVSVEVGDDGEDVTITVSDEGPGLPAGDEIFQPFFTTKVNGTGLGLAVVRQTAQAHGGSVEASAGEGGGARLTIRLPKPLPKAGLGGPAA